MRKLEADHGERRLVAYLLYSKDWREGFEHFQSLNYSCNFESGTSVPDDLKYSQQ